MAAVPSIGGSRFEEIVSLAEESLFDAQDWESTRNITSVNKTLFDILVFPER